MNKPQRASQRAEAGCYDTLQAFILRPRIETWTGLADPGQVAVADDAGIGVVNLQAA